MLTAGLLQPASAADFKLFGTQYSPSSALVSFAPTDPSALTTVLEGQDEYLRQGSVAAFDGQKLYVFTPKSNSQTGSLYKLTFTTYALANGSWALESSRQLTADYSNYPNAMAYDPSTGKLIGYRNGYPTTFYSIDTQTGSMTSVASIYNYYFTSLAFDKDGTCYGFDFESQLNRIDLAAATSTVVGATGQSFSDKQPTYIDAQTGTMYWVLTKSTASTLFTVDLATGAATRVGDMGSEAVLSDLFGAGSSVASDQQTPDAPSALSVSYTAPGSLSATLSATAPTLAYDKTTALSGEVTLSFYVDDAQEAAATIADVAPGADVSAAYTFASAGEHRVRVVASNANGAGPAKTVSTYAGFDTPKAPANVALSIVATGGYTLTWTAPTEGIHGGAIDQSSLSYAITQYPEGTQVGTTTETTFSGSLTTEAFASYSFGVKALSGTLSSDEAMSNTATYGDYADLPYYDDFTDEATQGLYTIVNTNGDATWTFGQGNLKKAAVYNGMGCSNRADDYLILPPMRMVKGVTYTLTFNAASAFNQDTGNHLAALLLDGTNGTTVKSTLGTLENIADYTGGMTETTYTYQADADGVARFAFYCTSLAGKKLCLYDVYVTATGYSEGPMNVSNLSAVAGEKGAHEATVSFTAPKNDVKGRALTLIDHISIYRDGAQLATHKLKNVEPGAECTWKDETVGAGKHSYRVVCYTDKGASNGISTAVLVGEDVPGEVTNLVITEQDDAFLLTWSAPTTALNGGYVDYDNLNYSVYYSYGLMENPELYQSEVQATQLLVPKTLVADYASAHQILLTFLVLAETENGYSTPAYADIIYGKPYGLPFNESFAYGSVDTDPWTVASVSDNYIQSWSMITGTSSSRPLDIAPADDDNGMAMFYHAGSNGYEARLLSPQVSIEGAKNPVLSLYVYHISSSSAANSSLTIEQKFPDSADYETLDVISVQGETGWQQHKVSLKAADGDAHNLFRIILRGKADNKQPIFVDAVSIADEESTGISSTETGTSRAYTLSHSIVVEGQGAAYSVFTTAGKQVARGTVSGRQSIAVGSGIYLVQLDGKTMKVVVR